MQRNIKNSLKHVFVSYSHENVSQRDQVVERLQQADIPVWLDGHLEAGIKWKPQIDEALEDAFAIVVVVTPESMKSLYVTYEWSWAIGSDVPVFPLLLAGSFDDVHSRLLDEQVVDCRQGIPHSVIEAIHSKQRTPSDLEYLNGLVHSQVEPLRVYIRVVTWMSSRLPSDGIYDEPLEILLNDLIDYAYKLMKSDLPELLVEKAFAFTRKQKQCCRAIIEVTHKIWAVLNYWRMLKDRPKVEQKGIEKYKGEMLVWLKGYYEDTWIPTVEAYDETYSLAQALDRYLGLVPDLTPEEEEEITDMVAKLNNTTSDEVRKTLQNTDHLKDQHTKAIAFSLIYRAYKKRNLEDVVWDMINDLRSSTSSS